MASKYNIAQCLLNEEKHTPEEIQVLLKQGEENEGAMVRLLPKVETVDAEYAVFLVTRLVGDMVALVGDNVATTKAERIKRDILKCLRRNGGRMERSELTLRTRQHSRNDRNDAIDDLIDAGQIEAVYERGDGLKNITTYKLAQ